MYYRSRDRRGRGRSVGYLTPFLMIICVGIIIILGVNLWKSIFGEEVKGDAFLHIESGSVQVKMWGSEEFLDFTSDALVMEGDEIRVSSSGKVVLEFFDGTIIRLGGDSSIILSEIDGEGDYPMINVLLVDGSFWCNKLYRDTSNTNVTVTMSNVVVNSTGGSIFELENDFDEVVRVFHGENVEVDILNEDTGKVVETENVGVGQEIVFTDKVLERYWQYQSPSVLEALSDEFKQTDWYLWNDAEDKAPVEIDKSAILGGDEFVEVAPEVFEPVEEVASEDDGSESLESEEEVVEDEPEEEVEEAEEETEEEVVDLGELVALTITSVSGITEVNSEGFYVIVSNLATLTGSVSGAEKVLVNEYTLQKFSPGDSTWTYYANADYDLMQEGENVYEVYALAPNGDKSESVFVKVYHSPPVEEEPASEESVPEEESVEEETPVEEPTD